MGKKERKKESGKWMKKERVRERRIDAISSFSFVFLPYICYITVPQGYF